MVEINIAYKGQLRCEAVHAPSGSTIGTDAPADNMGKGERFSPTDLVATGLGSCILTILGIVAQRKGLDLGDATVCVKKEMVADPLRRIGRLSVDVCVPAALSEADRKLLENAARTCPVHKSLHPSVEVPITFHWKS
jgi:putative redox protein